MRRKSTLLTVPAVSFALAAVAVAGCGGNNDDNVKASAPAASAKVSTPSGTKVTVGLRRVASASTWSTPRAALSTCSRRTRAR